MFLPMRFTAAVHCILPVCILGSALMQEGMAFSESEGTGISSSQALATSDVALPTLDTTWRLPEGARLGLAVNNYRGLTLWDPNPFTVTVAYWASDNSSDEPTFYFTDTNATISASDAVLRASARGSDGKKYQFMALFPMVALESFDFAVLERYELNKVSGGILGAFESRETIAHGRVATPLP